MKKRTIFYFDGFNLYHGMLKDTPQRWLDLDAFARTLLPRPEEHEIVRINYFTARIKYGSSANCRKPFCPAATHPNTAGHFGKPRCRVGTPPLLGCIRRSALQPIIP